MRSKVARTVISEELKAIEGFTKFSKVFKELENMKKRAQSVVAKTEVILALALQAYHCIVMNGDD